MRVFHAVVAAAAAFVVTVAGVRVADACGCVSPPVPSPIGDEQYAVNQQAEQIIFEVDKGWVTAHVLIKYSGAPEQFAWIVPVPEVPELGLSPTSAFGLLDRLTAPEVQVSLANRCPTSAWQCRYHPPADCGGFNGGSDDSPSAFSDAGVSGANDAGGGLPPVTVLDTQTVGDYQTVTFTAAEATAALAWLNDNGFIVNSTMAPYMQPYVDDGMVFVAAKLVPGASTATAIRPLRMRFRGPWPMIPLVLTAVAAEPHLTVNAFIFGDTLFQAQGHPVATIDPTRIARDAAGRTNYPMVLARAVDDAGGDGFVTEYQGVSPRPEFGQGTSCCGTGFDQCGLGGNGQCECPRDPFDATDCEAENDLAAGVALLDGLAARHPLMTRITTRLSPEEMTFDPQFEPAAGPPAGRLRIDVSQASLAGCEAAVIDDARFSELETLQACATTYCGRGQCVATGSGGACACDPEYVARRFIDLDGAPSVTCVPAIAPVDLGAGGIYLPNTCAGISCGQGACVDRNGVPHCICSPGAAAVAGAGVAPRCEPVVRGSGGPGAQDWSDGLSGLAVCAPEPPSCGAGGWLVEVGAARPGTDCGNARPTAAQQRVPEPPHCGGLAGIYGCSCGAGGGPIAPVSGGLIVIALVLRRRKPAPARSSRA